MTAATQYETSTNLEVLKARVRLKEPAKTVRVLRRLESHSAAESSLSSAIELYLRSTPLASCGLQLHVATGILTCGSMRIVVHWHCTRTR
jgi:hypothetical protein